MKDLICPSCKLKGGVFPMTAGDYGCKCGFVSMWHDFEDYTDAISFKEHNKQETIKSLATQQRVTGIWAKGNK